jgi:peptidoglycan/LPS O-acetylase OafA/YrhL
MQRLPGIHGLRAIAALGVIAFHVAFVPGYVTLPPILGYIIPQLGLGVPLFFVLSAFSLAYSHDDSVGKRGWIWPYLLKRLFRIAPLFWAMMAVYWYFGFPAARQFRR